MWQIFHMQRESERTLLIHVPYSVSSDYPSGVGNIALGQKEHLAPFGYRSVLVAPPVPRGLENGADVVVGRRVRLRGGGTVHDSMFLFNQDTARQIIDDIAPSGIILHEPYGGHGAHTIISALPKREDGKPIPLLAGHFHSYSERLDLPTGLALFLGRHLLRRPRFNPYGLPRGFTAGYISTVANNLEVRFAPSRASASLWKRLINGRFEVIPNAVDAAFFNPEGPKITDWQQDEKKTILFTGRHDKRKGLEDLLFAFSLLRLKRADVKLKIAGAGQVTKRLKELVRRWQIPDVEFLGVLPADKLPNAYRSADVYVSPPTGGESFGIVLIEAMASGIIPVGTQIRGYREVIGGKAFARMAEGHNPLDLADKIEGVLNLSAEERRRLGRQGREEVLRKYDWPIVARMTAEALDKAFLRHGTIFP